MTRLLAKIFNNALYKVASIVLAALFWYIVQGEEILEINRKIQVTLQVPKGYLIRGSRTRYKDATLSGSRALLSDFSSGPIEAKIQIPKGHIGKLRFRIDKEYISNWNHRIKLTVHDAYLNVFVDEQATRDVEIKESIIGLPADGYIVEKVSIHPNRAVVTGLKSEVKVLKSTQTEPVDISGLQESKTFDVNVAPPPKASQWTSLSIDTAKVRIQIGEKKVNKRFSSIPIEVESTLQTRILPKYVKIEIQGTPGVLNLIRRSELRAFIDLKDLAPGRYLKPIQVKIPADTVLIETVPEKASVEIFRQKIHK